MPARATYPDWVFPWFSSYCPGKCRHSSSIIPQARSYSCSVIGAWFVSRPEYRLSLRIRAVPITPLIDINTPWPESASDRRLSAKLVSSFADRWCHVVSMTDPYDGILGFLDRSRYFFFQVAPQLYSQGWVNPVPDPLLHWTFGTAGNRTRTSGSVARNSDH
jgi:hypothetical protein